MKNTIVVLGSTGNIGRPLVEELVRKKADVHPASRKTGFELGDVSTYARTFEGADSLFLLTPVDPRTVELTRKVIDAAKRAGVRRVVKVSALGASATARMTFGKWHHEAENVVRESGLEWTFLQPNGFMQNFVNAYAPVIKAQGAFYLPLGDAKISWVDTRDIAAAAAVALNGGHGGKTIVLTGPESLSGADCASKLSIVVGRDIRYVAVGEEQARQGMGKTGMPAWLVDALLELYAVYRTGEASVVSAEGPRLTGRPGTAFEQFATDHSVAFR